MIRSITRDEIPQCVELIKESFLGVAEEFNITQENAPRYVLYATTDEKLSSQYEQGRPMIAYEEDGYLVGYYSLAIIDEEQSELNNLCVLPRYRHQKIGEKLIQDAISRSKQLGLKTMILSIIEENERLKRWYQLNGAIHIGVKKFDFFPFTCGYMKINL